MSGVRSSWVQQSPVQNAETGFAGCLELALLGGNSQCGLGVQGYPRVSESGHDLISRAWKPAAPTRKVVRLKASSTHSEPSTRDQGIGSA